MLFKDSRSTASVENSLAFYIYPEAQSKRRNNASTKWDKINPLIFKALDDVMSIYNIPALMILSKLFQSVQISYFTQHREQRIKV